MNVESQRQEGYAEDQYSIGGLDFRSRLLSEECVFKKCCKKYKKPGKRHCKKCPKF
ncbi:MAG: hypothetical protein AAF632_25330 [Bacteroidota bacterium]